MFIEALTCAQRSHEQLAEFRFNAYELDEAMSMYLRTRECCSTQIQLVGIYLQMIKIYVELNQYSHIVSYARKIEQSSCASDPVYVCAVSTWHAHSSPHRVMSKVRAAMGMNYLHVENFKAAAECFLEVKADLGTTFNDVRKAPVEVCVSR